MSKLLEIVINHWNEPWEVGSNALMMLAVQRRVDWDNIGVTMIHDGSDKFPQKYFKDFPFKVKQVSLPQGGISAARNYAIDHSDATWIKFCDFDDLFAGAFSVSCIIDGIINATNNDMLWFPLLVDTYTGNPLILQCSPVFIHDKVFRVSFLNKNNIRFNEKLYYSEDFAFMSLIRMIIEESRIGKIESNFPIYIFVHRMGSVNNRKDMWFRNRCGHFDAHCYVENELRKHGWEHEADKMVARTMAESYFVLTLGVSEYDFTEYKQKMWDFFDERQQYFDRLNSNDIETVIQQTNKQNGGHLNKDGFLRWITKHIKDRGEQPHE